MVTSQQSGWCIAAKSTWQKADQRVSTSAGFPWFSGDEYF
jgi:hypothetical protein